MRAQAAIGQLDRRPLDAPQKKSLRAIDRALGRVADAEYGPWPQEHPITTVYESARCALADLAVLERGLDVNQVQLVTDATSALHEAEDTLSAAYWRGNLGP